MLLLLVVVNETVLLQPLAKGTTPSAPTSLQNPQEHKIIKYNKNRNDENLGQWINANLSVKVKFNTQTFST